MAELPFSPFNSVEPSLLTLTEALESVEEESFLTLLDDEEDDDFDEETDDEFDDDFGEDEFEDTDMEGDDF